VLEVAPPGPVQLAVTLAAQPPDSYASARAAVQTLRGAQLERHLSAIAEIAQRASADQVLLVDATGGEVRARLFDPDAGVLDPRQWKGRVQGGTLPGLADFVAGKGGTVLTQPTVRKRIPTKALDTSDTWSHWYSWVIAGALAAAATVFIVNTAASHDELTIRAAK
jgi:hypothetical protein